MGQSAVKNPRRIFSQLGGDATLPARVTTLENNEYKILYFETISTATGTIIKPTNSTILLDQFYSGGDAIVETLSNGQPTGQSPLTAGGVVVSVSSFDTSGNYTLSGTPSSFDVALVYLFKIKAIDYSNIVLANQLGMESTLVDQTIIDGSTNAVSGNSVFDALALKKDTVTVPVGYLTNTTPADSTTYYIGGLLNTTAQVSAGTSRRLLAPITGNVIGFEFVLGNAAVSSSEPNTFVLRNVSLGTTVTMSSTQIIAGQTLAIMTGFSLAVTGGDVLQIEWTTPIWVTNPLNTQLSGVLIFEKI